MRIPNTAEFLALFVTTGQLTGFSNQPSADLDSEALAPACNQPPFRIVPRDTCEHIAKITDVPMYQIICQNDEINGRCTNLKINQQICLGRKGEDCRGRDTRMYFGGEGNTPRAIADYFNIPLHIFEANNYCYKDNDGITICPKFIFGMSVCASKTSIGKLPKCEKIFPKD